ncbi:hypothetical protein GCM10022393_26810 [Aquimarina addita]|uniref:Uncharacterized protein n=1 Tax=Aquimarina addita TaxID=870485 RepID=A0ABP6UNX7_9FLAO
MNQHDKRIYNLGYINGWLANMARINDKTNHGYDFRLTKFEKTDQSLEEQLSVIFDPICTSFNLEKIKNPREYLIKSMLEYWFFEFQEKPFSNIFLSDRKNNFSLSDDDWKKEWVEEFLEVLLYTVSSDETYHLTVGKTKGFYVCASSEIIFVNKQEIFHLHFSVSD